VVIADADPLARRVIRDALQSMDGFIVVAEAKDGVEALELTLHCKPELVLMETGLPRLDGIKCCRAIIEGTTSTSVVFFTVEEELDTQLRALTAGASGFISKSANMESVERALRAVASGKAAISRRLTAELITRLRASLENGLGMRPVKSVLTNREWEVLDLMCVGSTTRTISDALFLTEDTVYTHAKSILRKLGVRSRAAAVLMAEQMREPGAAGRERPPAGTDSAD
jgi:DNA-binding NarL/FixJ family response regulator